MPEAKNRTSPDSTEELRLRVEIAELRTRELELQVQVVELRAREVEAEVRLSEAIAKRRSIKKEAKLANRRVRVNKTGTAEANSKSDD